LTIVFSFSWHFGPLRVGYSARGVTLFYTTFTDVIERRDFTVIFFPFFQEAAVILQFSYRNYISLFHQIMVAVA